MLILISVSTLLWVAPSHSILFTWDGQALIEASTSPSGLTIPTNTPLDLDKDGSPESVTLQEGKVEIQSDGQPVWSSPSNWEVAQAETTDLNHDGSPEIALLLWRQFAPWPIDAYIPQPGRIADFHNRNNRSCHLILIGWSRGVYRELWAGSALADPLFDITPIDLDHDGQQELAALESRYDAPFFEANAITVWEWNGFGFTLLSRSPKGYFHSLNLVQTSTGEELLLAQGFLRR